MRKVLLMTSFLLSVVCYSSYIETTYSAEMLRLANNVAKDYTVESVFLNPASLKNVYVPELLLTYNLLYPNLTDETKFLNNSAMFVQKLPFGGVGLGFNQFGVKDWYTRDKFVISFGRMLTEFIPNFSAGVKLGYFRESYSLDEYMKHNPVFANGSEKSVLSVSLGVAYDTVKFGRFGLTIENINRPNVGFYTEEYLPLEINFGNVYNYGSLNFYPGIKIELATKTDYSFTLSTEYEFYLFKDKLKLSPSLGIIYGSRELNKLLFGFSLQTLQIKFTYGISISPMSKIDTGFHQCVTLSYKFVPQPVISKVPKEEYDKIVEEKIKLEKELETLKKYAEKKYEKPVSEEKPVPSPPAEGKVEQPTTTEELLLKKIEELERRLKETEAKPKPQVTPQPATPTTTVPPPVTPKKRYHTVVAGDTLPKLAEKYYGDSSQWRKIYEANKDKIIRGQLVPGSVLEIP